MRIDGIAGPAIEPAARRASAQRHEPDTGTRALIAIAPVAPSRRAPTLTRHPVAPFLAQLIATKMQAPQTRARRRAEPTDAITVYRTGKSAPPRTAGRKAEFIA